MSFNKITTSDLTNKGVSGLPDTPGLSTSEMQRKFDEIGKEVIVPKFNELVDELNKNGNVIKASDIVGIRVNANKQIEVTTDFNTWYATASSGHVVIDKNGNTLPQRGTMKFVGESLVYDDPEHEQTVITAIQGVQGEEGPIGPVGPKGDRGQVYIPSIDEQGNISWTPADYTVPPAVRNIRGPQGVQGVQGPRGERGYNGKDGRSFSVLGQYESLEALQIAHPVGNEGDAYSVQLAEGNTIYLWDVDKREWVDIGSLQGPQGPQGEQGIQGIQGPPGIQGERGIPTSVNGLIGESIEVTPAVIPYTESKSLADLLGTTDISEIGDGTVTGGLDALNTDTNEIGNLLGNTDISAIGDGTVTGGLDALNSNLSNKANSKIALEYDGTTENKDFNVLDLFGDTRGIYLISSACDYYKASYGVWIVGLSKATDQTFITKLSGTTASLTINLDRTLTFNAHYQYTQHYVINVIKLA